MIEAYKIIPANESKHYFEKISRGEGFEVDIPFSAVQRLQHSPQLKNLTFEIFINSTVLAFANRNDDNTYSIGLRVGNIYAVIANSKTPIIDTSLALILFSLIDGQILKNKLAKNKGII